MRSSLLARGRALAVCACAAIAAGLSGCTGRPAQTGSSIAGHTLTIYLSKPAGASTTEQQDVIAAEQLALHQMGNHVAGFTIKVVQTGGNELSDNGRGAIADPTTIAYLGELGPGTSAQTIGITNAQDILQVSPTDTALQLTQAVPEISGSPDLYYESLSTNGRTFARVVPNDKLEAKVLVGEMQSLGVKRLVVASDGSEYGKALRGAVIGDAGSAITLVSTPASADAVLYAGSSVTGPVGAVQAFNQAVASHPGVKLFAPSALADDQFAGRLSSAAQRDLYVSSPGFTSGNLPPQGQQFVSAFKAAYGRAPLSDAIFGYEAMASVLSVLRKAGSAANNRGTVVKDFFAIRKRSSVLGTYSINTNGDISFASGAPFLISQVRQGRLVAVKAVAQQG